MPKIGISGMEDKKPPVTPVTPTKPGTSSGAGSSGTSSGGSGANSGTTNTGAGTSSGTSGGNAGNTGGVIRGTGSSGSKFDSWEFPFLNLGNKNRWPQAEKQINEERAKTAISALKNKYAQNLRNEYDYAAKKLKEERDDALRENWVLQQQAEAALPEQMAASGINGGATETSLAALKARYQGDRNGIRGNYMDNLSELSIQNQSERAAAERNLDERWLEYLLSIAQNSYAKSV